MPELSRHMRMGWPWVDGQPRMITNVGPDPPNNQRVNAVWILRRRSWIVNGATGGDVGVDFGGCRDIAGSDTGYRSIAGNDIVRCVDGENGVSRRDTADSGITC